MPSQTVKVSIIIPCYNQGQYLEETLQSVLNQTLKEWECVIIDDGSTDKTKEIAENLVSLDQRVSFFSQKNQGVSTARNNGISRSKGKFILPLDADDLISPTYLEEAVQILESKPSVKIVYSQAEKFGESEGGWHLPEFELKSFLLSNSIFCSALFRRSDFDQTIGFNPNMDHGWEDWDFWLSLLESGGEVYKIPKVHFYYRIRPNSRTKGIDEKVIKHLQKRLFTNHYDFYEDVFGSPFDLIQKNNLLSYQLNAVKNSTTFKVANALNKLIQRIKRPLKPCHKK